MKSSLLLQAGQDPYRPIPPSNTHRNCTAPHPLQNNPLILRPKSVVCVTQPKLVMYLHVTLVCVDPVKQRLWSHPFYRETTLRGHTQARGHRKSTHNLPRHSLISCQRSTFKFNHCLGIPLLAQRLICEGRLGDKVREEYFPEEHLHRKSNRADKQDQR